MQNKRVCVVGAGAVGGYVGAHLTHSGVDTTLLDFWPEHVEHMQRNGITVTGIKGAGSISTAVRVLHFSDVAKLVREQPFDIVIMAVKSYDTRWATQMIMPYMASGGFVVSMQNSINEPEIAEVVGWNRVIGCSVGLMAAELVGPGQIERNTLLGDDKKAGFRLGEPHGRITHRLEAVADMLRCADSVKATTNLWGERWSKLTINAMRNGVSALTGMTGRERDISDVARTLTIRLGSSSVRVGQALGMELEPVGGLDLELLSRCESDERAMQEMTDMILSVAHSRSDSQRPSMAQDITKKRRTETDHINGMVAARGRESGIDVALHERVNDTMHLVEKGALTVGPQLLSNIVQ